MICIKCNIGSYGEIRLISQMCPQCYVDYWVEELESNGAIENYSIQKKPSKAFFNFLKEMEIFKYRNPIKYKLFRSDIKLFVRKQQRKFNKILSRKMRYSEL